MSVAISVRGVAKRFRHGGPDARTLKEHVVTGFRNVRERHEFWALEDVSLEVPAGASVGILGPNGAGKTTLLRLIGGIGRPTRGTIDVKGRLSAIFELGAGFHPDLTGRESVLLAGIIAGLSRDEIRGRMDEIVEFAELREFIDEPIRMYSTGMVARLAFSVATNVDAEVLLVDEVLAVGDLAFQRKCRERFEEFKSAGVTLLLVTHDPSFVADLCDEAVWLQGGRVAATGSPNEITELYRTAMQQRTIEATPDDAPEVSTPGGATLRIRHNRWGTQEAQVQNVRLIDGQGSTLGRITSGGRLTVEADVVVPTSLGEVRILVHILRSDGVRCVDTSTLVRGAREGERHTAVLAFDRLDLAPGDYAIEVGLYNINWGKTYDFHSGVYGLKVLGESSGEAVVMPPHRWTVRKPELGGP
ncbi:MAG: ABC transporter ATP-binding protein [Actinomycetota bacterium]